MSTGIKQVENGITKALDAMISRTKTVSSYLNRNLFRQYQKAQIERWQTEGASQGQSWQPLLPSYQKYKRKKFAAYPGGGNTLMVATGRLSSGAMGRDSAYFYKLVTDEKFEIGINISALPYAPYPGVMRPYMKFTEDTLDEWRKGIMDYVARNVQVML